MACRQSSLAQTVPVLPFGAKGFTMALSGGNTVETYIFYHQGTSGTAVAQWVITYTDSNRTTLVSGVYTDLSA